MGLELDWTALGCLCSCSGFALAGAAVVAGAGAGLRATARPKESTTKDLICRGFLVVVLLDMDIILQEELAIQQIQIIQNWKLTSM